MKWSRLSRVKNSVLWMKAGQAYGSRAKSTPTQREESTIIKCKHWTLVLHSCCFHRILQSCFDSKTRERKRDNRVGVPKLCGFKSTMRNPVPVWRSQEPFGQREGRGSLLTTMNDNARTHTNNEALVFFQHWLGEKRMTIAAHQQKRRGREIYWWNHSSVRITTRKKQTETQTHKTTTVLLTTQVKIDVEAANSNSIDSLFIIQ